MGFYLRKSQRIGPFRINFSKSGIGVSTGVKGFRVSQGPRGAMVHMGRHGLYYRTSLGKSRSNSGATGHGGARHSSESPSAHPLDDGLAQIDSASTETIVDTDSQTVVDLIRAARAKPRSVWLAPLPLLAGLIFPTAFVGLVLFSALLAAVFAFMDRRRRTANIAYDISHEMEGALQEFYDAFDKVFSSRAVWNVGAEMDDTDPSNSAKSSERVKLEPVRVSWGQPKGVNTNVRVPSLPVGRQVLYFLPDMLLVDEKTRVGAVSYKRLTIEEDLIAFVEYGLVPSDAEVIRTTWQHANKDGSPDRRFKHNRQIPVLKYLQIRLSSDTGLHELTQISNAGVQGVFSSAANKLASTIPNSEE